MLSVTPALVKMKSDVGVEMSCRMKVTVAQADVEATAEADSLKQTPRKPFPCSPVDVPMARCKPDPAGKSTGSFNGETGP
jgi:hypothetical protein